MHLTLPNMLTLLRILLIPIMVFVYFLPFQWNHWGAGIIFVIAALTDWLDGYLARTLQQTSAFGAFLDPVADKLLVAVALVLVVSHANLPFLALPAAVIIGREIAVSALREWMSKLGRRASVAVSMIGKVKTGLQMVAVPLLLVYQPGHYIWMGVLGYILLFLAAGLTLWSMIQYLKAAWPDLTFQKKTQ
jgi:CDP-diacylglycerol---glycerol-3-phosphate 3-phosphatidyltransferase